MWRHRLWKTAIASCHTSWLTFSGSRSVAVKATACFSTLSCSSWRIGNRTLEPILNSPYPMLKQSQHLQIDATQSSSVWIPLNWGILGERVERMELTTLPHKAGGSEKKLQEDKREMAVSMRSERLAGKPPAPAAELQISFSLRFGVGNPIQWEFVCHPLHCEIS